MRETFCNSAEDCKWLRETHLRGIDLGPATRFKSFVLYGNEDAPEMIDLYLAREPKVTDRVWTVRPSA